MHGFTSTIASALPRKSLVRTGAHNIIIVVTRLDPAILVGRYQ